jgi:hypothetical protein
MAAIPTRYNGIQFRSRLEARYAAYFDLRGDTEWQYEPLEMPGWIPDFTITVHVGEKTAKYLVEVKPIEDVKQFANSDDGKKVLKAIAADFETEKVWFNYHGFLIMGLSPAYMWYWPGPKGFHKGQVPNENLIACWKEAGNRTQWRRPR